MKLGKLIGQGRTAEVYEWENNTVIKLFNKDMSKDAIIDEYKINQELTKLRNVPVAKTYDVVEINDRYGIVYEFISAPSMMTAMSSKPWKLNALAKTLATLHKSLQINVNFSIQNQNERLKQHIGYTDLLTDDIKQTLYAYIDSLPCPNILCHGDLHPENVLIEEDAAIIIDWMTATKGDPLSDVARTSIMFKYGILPDNMTWIQKFIIQRMRQGFLNTYLKTYIHISGVKKSDIDKWELPMAAARLIEGIPPQEKELLLELIHRKLKTMSLQEKPL